MTPGEEEFRRGVCTGTNDRGTNFAQHHYQILKNRYTNCTRILGNLEITHIDGLSTHFDGEEPFAFLHDIQEITGYLLIFSVENVNIRLPNLRIIWGDHLFEGKSLYISLLLNVTFLSMPVLTKIEAGNISILGASHLCHLKYKVDWKQLLGDRYKYLKKSDLIGEYDQCVQEEVHCHSTCGNNCWEDGQEECQIVFDKICPSACHGHGCYPHNDGFKCCDSMCSAGCYGGGKKHCYACANYTQDGECVQKCRGVNYFNTDSGRLSDLSVTDRRYTFYRYCVDTCPPEALIEQDHCVTRCRKNYFYNETLSDRTCKPCGDYCSKICHVADPLTHFNIGTLSNCEYVDGSIIINETNAPAAQNQGFPYALKLEDLDNLRNVKLVTDYVYIMTRDSQIYNLQFLQNLETIVGRKMYHDKASLLIDHNDNLRTLSLKSLKSIKRGHVTISKNHKLCLVDTIKWHEIFPTIHFSIRQNANAMSCEKRNVQSCHSECSSKGCWASDAESCVSCSRFVFNGACTANCPKNTYAKDFGKGICDACHEECNGCKGPSKFECEFCKNVVVFDKNGQFHCAEECPATHYQVKNECMPCHSSCYQYGCTGPSDNLDNGGCNTCDYAREEVEHGKEHKYICLVHDKSPETVCEDVGLVGYFRSATKPKNGKHVEKYICQKCDEECESCTGIGRSVEYHGCKCKNKILHLTDDPEVENNEECVKDCPTNSFIKPDESGAQICFECHNLCDKHKGCSGPSLGECFACENAGFTNADGTITCAEQCSEEFKFLNEHDRLCYAVDIAEQTRLRKKTMWWWFGSSFCVVMLILLILLCVCVNYRKKYQKEVALNMPSMPDFDYNKCKPPVMRRINLISLDELEQTSKVLGEGEFGTVYAGKWKNPMKGTSTIPVAIKVMKAQNAYDSKEILDEAGMMANVSGGHKHLHPIVGICLNETVQIVTLLRPLGSLLFFLKKHKDRLGSSKMLQYSYQIASAMNYLYNLGMVHRDLAARNVLVKTISHVEVTDFGLAKMMKPNETLKISGKAAVKWLAIETLSETTYSHATDVWAFAVTVWEILTLGQSPYQGISINDIRKHLLSGYRLEQPNNCTPDLYQTLLQCWMVNPESRPNFDTLKETFNSFCKAPHQYVIDFHFTNKMELISNMDQRKMIADMLNDEDFEDPLEYQDVNQLPSARVSSEPFFNESPTSPNRPLLPATKGSFKRFSSVSTHRYHTDPCGSKAGSSRLESIEDSGDNYLIPNDRRDEDTASVYTAVVNAEEHEYYNDVGKDPGLQKSASGDDQAIKYINQENSEPNKGNLKGSAETSV
uniref:Receptor protein-tyrosine kinase n=1 Tax=Rhabditophanes sp. KR3021 TaxID=114890 RepID=A0AC35TZ63_9BILA